MILQIDSLLEGGVSGENISYSNAKRSFAH